MAIGLIVLVIAGLVVETGRGGPKHQTPAAVSVIAPPRRPTTTSTTISLPPTFLGPAGVEARWVIAENQRSGTTAWQINGPGGEIAGFADHVAAQVGDTVTFYVTTAAPTFQIDAFRMGYYQGAFVQGDYLFKLIGAGGQQSYVPLTV